jgi:hypothetical protein
MDIGIAGILRFVNLNTVKMSNPNFIISSSGNPSPAKLMFHDFVIYDNENWTQDGTLMWNATTKNFYVQPTIPVPEAKVDEKKIFRNKLMKK